MFAKKVKVQWQVYCSQCSKELAPGDNMILMIYTPTAFSAIRRELIRLERETRFLCEDCLRECVQTIENHGHYASEFSTLARKKRIHAELKKH